MVDTRKKKTTSFVNPVDESGGGGEGTSSSNESKATKTATGSETRMEQNERTTQRGDGTTTPRSDDVSTASNASDREDDSASISMKTIDLYGINGTALILFAELDKEYDRIVSLDVNTNSVSAEITSKIQNTLADNPIGDETNESKRLKTSDMVAVLANRPERRERLTRVSAKRVSDKICDISMPDTKFFFWQNRSILKFMNHVRATQQPSHQIVGKQTHHHIILSFIHRIINSITTPMLSLSMQSQEWQARYQPKGWYAHLPNKLNR